MTFASAKFSQGGPTRPPSQTRPRIITTILDVHFELVILTTLMLDSCAYYRIDKQYLYNGVQVAHTPSWKTQDSVLDALTLPLLKDIETSR